MSSRLFLKKLNGLVAQLIIDPPLLNPPFVKIHPLFNLQLYIIIL